MIALFGLCEQSAPKSVKANVCPYCPSLPSSVVKKKKKTAVAPTPIPVLGTGMTTSDMGMTTPGSLAGSKEILMTEWEQEKA